MFDWKSPHLVNEKGKYLDIEGYNDREDAHITFHGRNNRPSQKWEMVYVDEYKPEPVKGELNTDYNLVVERPFYVVSALGSGKYLDILGRNMVIKTRNGRNT